MSAHCGQEAYFVSVKLSSRQVGDVNVVDVAAGLLSAKVRARLRDALRDMVGKNQKKILLNLGGCFLY